MAKETKSEEKDNKSKSSAEGEFVTKEEFKNMQKGIEKLANSVNSKSSSKNKSEEDETIVSPIVKRLYTKENPEINEVWDEVVEESNKLGLDPLEYYESKKGWQLEAKARLESKQSKEDAKNSVESPSGKIVSGKINYDNIKPEQIRKLSSKAREEYRQHLRNKDGGTLIIRRQQ